MTLAAAYFTIEELRAEYPDLTNTTKYPNAKLEAARAFAEQWFEAAAKVAYVPREVTETLTGNGNPVLFVSHYDRVRPPTVVKIDGVELTAGDLSALKSSSYGALLSTGKWPKDAAIEITYTHGYDEPVELARQAVMMLAAEHAKPSTIPARATSLSTDVGNYRISQADKTGQTGIPDVDAIIGLLGDDKPVTG